MRFYGFQHWYGSNVRGADGELIGQVVIFDSRRALDIWIDKGPPYLNTRGARTKITCREAKRWLNTHDMQDAHAP